MTKVKLTYFDGRGRAECIRILLKIGKVDFEDVRVTFSEWPKVKPSKTTITFFSIDNIQ